MGAYKYVTELYKKKQSDVLRFLLRVRYVSEDSRLFIFPDSRVGAGSTVN